MIYVIVRDGGTVISKEAYAGDTEMALEQRKAAFSEYNYQVVAKAAFDAIPETGSNYLMAHRDFAELETRGNSANAKRNEILAGRGQ